MSKINRAIAALKYGDRAAHTETAPQKAQHQARCKVIPLPTSPDTTRSRSHDKAALMMVIVLVALAWLIDSAVLGVSLRRSQ